MVKQTIGKLGVARSQAEARVHFIQQTLELLNESVVVDDSCGRLLFFNDKARQQLGDYDLRQEILLSVLAAVQIDKERSWAQVLSTLMTTGKAFSLEWVVLGSGQ